MLPSRHLNSHKGTYGTVIVIGGSPLMIGAPAFTATAALRIGAGLVKIMTQPNLILPILSLQPSATAIPLPTNIKRDLISRIPYTQKPKTVLALGPGLSISDAAIQTVQQIIAQPNYHVVLDADGLNILAQLAPSPNQIKATLTLTPHPGEFQRLAAAYSLTYEKEQTDPASSIACATQLARLLNATIVLKSHATLIVNPDQHAINGTGNPALATAGSGDVLTGIIAGLIAQGLSPFHAAQLGTHLHGLAADLWASIHGTAGLLASELTDHIPPVMQTYRKQ